MALLSIRRYDGTNMIPVLVDCRPQAVPGRATVCRGWARRCFLAIFTLLHGRESKSECRRPGSHSLSHSVRAGNTSSSKGSSQVESTAQRAKARHQQYSLKSIASTRKLQATPPTPHGAKWLDNFSGHVRAIALFC